MSDGTVVEPPWSDDMTLNEKNTLRFPPMYLRRWDRCKKIVAGGVRMRMKMQSRLCGKLAQGRWFVTAALVLVFMMLAGSQNANALPAFARKYGLRCSACHES